MSKPSRFTLSNALNAIKGALQRVKKFSSSAAVEQIEQTVDSANYSDDELSLSAWKKHIFIAPSFNNERLVPKLDYYIYTPAATAEHPTTKDMPLVVMLHGCTQNATVFAEGTRMNLFAQQDGFVALYPQQSITNNLGKCWRWFDLSDSKGTAEAHTIMSIIEDTIKMYELDPDKVFVAGLSAGAGMASILATYYPQKIRAVALHSGPALGIANDMKSGMNLMKNGIEDDAIIEEKLMALLDRLNNEGTYERPAMIIHGMEDDVVHFDNANALSKQFLYLNNLSINSKAAVSQHLVGTEKEYTQTEYKHHKKTLVELITVKHLDHGWSGGDTKYPFNSDKGPQASHLVWDFFKKHL